LLGETQAANKRPWRLIPKRLDKKTALNMWNEHGREGVPTKRDPSGRTELKDLVRGNVEN